ncbi:MAG: ZIP family metal transporter [Bacilli bacterium]
MFGLLLTLGLGLFIVIGALIVFLTKNNEKFITFSLSIAFGVMIMLIITDLFPESYEILKSTMSSIKALVILVTSSIIGFIVLFILDKFVPDHEDDLTTTKDDKGNMKHIGLVSSIALVIHNIVEGMAISLVVASNMQAGLVACIGVGLHNIPLGMVIASTFYKSNQSKGKTMAIIAGIALSTFLGGLLVYFFKPTTIPVLLEGISLSVTIGMLLFIIILELLPKIIHTKYKTITSIGVISGVLLLVITLFI